jgi:hypothetical protein
MLIDIAPRGFEVRKRGLRFNKQQFHQFAGCIINIDQRGAGRATAFKPVVITAIYLYQLTSTRTPVLVDEPWLRREYGTQSPQPSSIFERFNRHRDVWRSRFSCGQRWSKVAVYREVTKEHAASVTQEACDYQGVHAEGWPTCGTRLTKTVH